MAVADADLTEILAEAEKLGKLIAAHPAIAKYKAAQKMLSDDPEAGRLMQEFSRTLETLGRQEQTGMPVTDAQRMQVEALQSRIASNLKVKSLNIAEVDFTELLRKVSQAWQRPLAGAQGQPAGASPGGASGARVMMPPR